MENVIGNITDMKHELSSSIRVWNHKKENAADCFQRYVEETGFGNAIAWYAKDVIQSEIVCEKLVEFQETIAGIGDNADAVLGHTEMFRNKFLEEVLGASFDHCEESHRLVARQEYEAYKTLYEIFTGLTKILSR